jgi:solute:Na+ symporter, SSS family
LGVVLDPLACAGTLVLSGIFFARPLWRMELFTMADFYRRQYGPSAEIVGACIQVPAYFSWVALQYTALARILELYFEIPFAAGIVLVAAITLVYTLVGGMWSVTLTDTVQIVIAGWACRAAGGDALRSTAGRWRPGSWFHDRVSTGRGDTPGSSAACPG